MTGSEPRTDLFLVPHTHWDREWYEPFQRFRLRLVKLLDEVLEQAQREPRFCFTLDGQMAAVDDYLEVRPESEERLRALVANGQLAIGPWQILLDEFLCSGENIVRNLELGMTRAEKFGGVLPVGYLPDMFGHCAQMPQVLSRAGLRQACVWRGVPAEVTHHAFRWEAPDGSSVRTEYLPAGYSNAAYVFADPDAVDGSVTDIDARLRPWYGSEPILAMYGTDHTSPIPDLVDVVARQGSGLTIRVGTLADYLHERDGAEKLATVRGELRSHARANILPGVLSARRDLKLGLRRAERMVERYAEPLAALYASTWPTYYLDLAWSRLIACSCHDSVTGCGVDETALQVAARVAEAEQAGQAVRDLVLTGIASRVPGGSLIAVNPSPRHRSGWVTVDVTVPDDAGQVAFELPDGDFLPTQELSRFEPLLAEWQLPAGELESVFASIHGHDLFGQTVLDARLDAAERSLTFTVGRVPTAPPLDLVALRRAVQAATTPGGAWTVRVLEQERRRVLARVTVPPLGWTALRPGSGDAEAQDPVQVVGHTTLDNGLLRVTVDAQGRVGLRARDGTEVADVARLVDGGDRGDTYTYAPPATDLLVDRPVRVAVKILERGPLRAAVTIARDYDWPGLMDWSADRRATEGLANATLTRVELRSGEPFLRMEIQVDNRCLDHRLRLHLVAAQPAETSCAEGQFAVVSRGLTAEGSSGETPVATFPASGFVDAGGVALLLDRPSEYELVDGGRQLAVTLLRSVGRLSRNVNPYRAEPAGPELPTPAAQCLGVSTTSVAVLPHGGSWHADGVLAAAEQWNHDLVATWGTGPGDVPAAQLSASGVELVGDGVVLSSLRRRGGWLELRVVAESPQPVPTTVRGGLTAARRCDLLGRAQEPVEVSGGELTVLLQPWEIATLQLRR